MLRLLRSVALVSLAAVAPDVLLHAALDIVVVAVPFDGLVEVAVDLVQITWVVEALDSGLG
jgi:hypothetical protein